MNLGDLQAPIATGESLTLEFKKSTAVTFVRLDREGVSEGVSEGIPAPLDLLNTSPKNVERWLQQLKTAGKIEFRGTPTTAAPARADFLNHATRP